MNKYIAAAKDLAQRSYQGSNGDGLDEAGGFYEIANLRFGGAGTHKNHKKFIAVNVQMPDCTEQRLIIGESIEIAEDYHTRQPVGVRITAAGLVGECADIYLRYFFERKASLGQFFSKPIRRDKNFIKIFIYSHFRTDAETSRINRDYGGDIEMSGNRACERRFGGAVAVDEAGLDFFERGKQVPVVLKEKERELQNGMLDNSDPWEEERFDFAGGRYNHCGRNVLGLKAKE